MAVRLPNAQDVSTKKFRGVREVLTQDVRGAGAGIQTAAESVSSIGKTMEEEYRAKASFDLEKAKAAYLIGQDQENAKYVHRNDFENIEKEWESGTKKLYDDSTGMILDAEKRAEFNNWASVQKQNSGSAMQKMAYAKEKDSEIAVLSHDLNKLTDRVAADPINSFDHIQTGRNRITSMFDKGYINGVQYEEMMRTFGDSTMVATIQSSGPLEAEKILHSKIAKENLPVETWIKLNKQNEDNLIEYKAVEWVNNNYKGDVIDARLGVQSISDPKLMAAVDKQLTLRVRNQENDKAVNQKQIFDNYSSAVFDRKMTTAEIKMNKPDDWEAMGASARSNLENFELRGSLPTYTPIQTTMKLHELRNEAEKTGNYKPLLGFIQGNSSGMSTGDNKAWAKIAVDGTYPPEIKSMLTFQQKIIAHIPEKMTPEQKGSFLNSYDEWAMNFQIDKKRLPYDAEIDDYLKAASLKAAYTEVGMIWDSTEEGGIHQIEDQASLEARKKAVATMTRFKIEPTVENMDRLQKLTTEASDYSINAANSYLTNNNMPLTIDNIETVSVKMNAAQMKVETALDAVGIQRGSEEYGNMYRAFFKQEIINQGL